jgi:pimeloyl-ACP methyl ester carboxylesterase
MTTFAITEAPHDAGTQRYREAELALWRHYGLEAKERILDLEQPALRLRVLEVGSGEPALFVHGTAGTGPYWAPLIRELQGVRCLLLDRPGFGQSSPLDYSRYEYKTVVADVLKGALEALGLDRAHVVAGSIGNVWAVRLAERHPSRVDRIVLLGGSPLVPEVPVPPVIRLLASPLGRVMVRMSGTEKVVRKQLRGVGHGPSLDDGRIPDEFVQWRAVLSRETDSMRTERDMVRAIVRGGEFRPGLTFADAELAAIRQPTLYVYGTADPVGNAGVWRRVADVMPRGEFSLVRDAGHMPWLDDPSEVAREVGAFLRDGNR